MKILASLIFISIFELAACNGQAPTAALSPVTPTRTLTSTPSATSTPSPEPSKINIPPVITPTTLLTQSEIVEAIKQQNYDKLCGGQSLNPTMSQSSDGQWVAVPCKPETIVRKIDGSQAWSISVDRLPFPDESRMNGDLFTRMWSDDGQYLYMTLFICCVDGPGGISLHDAALYRLDLVSGKLVEILKPLRTLYFYSFDLSQNYLIYSKPDSGTKIFIRDLIAETETEIKLDRNYETIGEFTWNADDETLFFAGEIAGWTDGSNGFSLLSLNLKNKSVTVLLDNNLQLFLPVGLLGPNKLLLWSNKAVDENHKYWAFNIITKQLASGPTPTPYIYP